MYLGFVLYPMKYWHCFVEHCGIVVILRKWIHVTGVCDQIH